MKDIFNEIHAIDNINASLFFSEDGNLILYEAKDFTGYTSENIHEFSQTLDWKWIVYKFRDIVEAELVFTKYRVYIRKADSGFLVILMGLMAPIEVVRLNVDLLMPELNSLKKSKGIGRFFKFR